VTKTIVMGNMAEEPEVDDIDDIEDMSILIWNLLTCNEEAESGKR